MSFIPATKSSGWPRRGIPFTLASDVHSHAQLGKDYDGLAQKMASRGVREVAVYHRHRRTLKEL